MNEYINIEIKIADRNYPLKIKASDEAKVKNAADKINGQLKELMQKYDGRDMQDYMAMYLMLQMNNSTKSTESPVQIDVSAQLKNIETELDGLLKF